jgi:surfeit locus 1 family protein
MPKLLKGHWLFKHIAVFLVLIVLINFGFWQLRRLEEKRTRNRNILAALDQPPLTLTGQDVDPATLHFHRVQVTGTFDNEVSMILRNRLLEGVSGVDILTPLHLSGSDQAVLVDRGWIPRGNRDPAPEERAAYDVSGEVTIQGIAYQGQPRPALISFLAPSSQEGQPPTRAWSRVDIEHIQEQLPYRLLPIFIEQAPDPTETSSDLPRRAGNITLDEGPHLGYAIQWFSFALILVITYAFFIRQELQKEG